MKSFAFRFTLLFILLLGAGVVFLAFLYIPFQVQQRYGPPAAHLPVSQQYYYTWRLYGHGDLLTHPLTTSGQSFTVSPGEPPAAIAARLEAAGIIGDARAFLDYLIYTGLDTSLQAGSYRFPPYASIQDIARAMQDPTPLEVLFVVLPGWRAEEIAASLPTSGLAATPESFLAAVRFPLDYPFLEGAVSNEGFLFPDTYVLPRHTDGPALVKALVRNFALHLTPDLIEGFTRQGLTIYQAVTLASIVEREAIDKTELPLLASVFLNRLKAGWRLDSDPTVQYALGSPGRWWPSPLSALDLRVDSPYNTYLYPGLPPGPIANPSLAALRAVAEPASTPYYFFRARCDGSGRHTFAVTLEEHIQNACP